MQSTVVHRSEKASLKFLQTPIVLKGLSGAEKRVLIAQDALAALTIGIFKADDGYGWLRLADSETVGSSDDLREKLNGATCEGCAAAALFVACVARFDAVRVQDLDVAVEADTLRPSRSCLSVKGSTLLGHLRKYFPERNLITIEAAYETVVPPPLLYRVRPVARRYRLEKDLRFMAMLVQAERFGLKAARGSGPGAKRRRLRAILRNIIHHNGTFCPQSEP